ncbi:MAG: SDR family oxidoreductase [Hyphomonadaceae bacterium]
MRHGRMRILIPGAGGFIGAHIAAHLAAHGHEIIAAARDVADASRRLPHFTWVEADFAQAVDWAAILMGVDAVINCVGVLQDGGKDSTRAAHIEGADALYAACEKAGVRRIIHISAIGADPEAATAYARTKHEGDVRLAARDLDWVIVKPSLVIARDAHGGTALARGLAALPFVTPLMRTTGVFQPIHMRDLCVAIEKLLAPGAPSRVVIEAAGPQSATLPDLIAAHQAWLGFAPTKPWIAPDWLVKAGFALGDAAGALGMRSSLRSTSRAQMEHSVGGDPASLQKHLGFAAAPFEAAMHAEPAGQPERWHARLYFARAAAIVLMAAFWIVTGIVCLTAGRAEAAALAYEAGLGALSDFAAIGGGAFDIAIGLALLVSPRKKPILLAMGAVTIFYLGALTLLLPHLWADPLGRLAKLIPFFALLLMLLATEGER